jgi:hypothetical protein
VNTKNKASESGLERQVDSLRTELLSRDKFSLAKNTGAEYRNGRYILEIWNKPVSIADDDFIAIDIENGIPCDNLTQAMLAYYMHTSDGAPVRDDWISFRELPGGQFYATAFQSYTGDRLTASFGEDIESFARASEKLNGLAQPFGDAAFYFQALPRVPVAVVCWLGDEDFPTSFRLLFDDSIKHHLPTDACAVLGSMLTRQLLTHKLAKVKTESKNS